MKPGKLLNALFVILFLLFLSEAGYYLYITKVKTTKETAIPNQPINQANNPQTVTLSENSIVNSFNLQDMAGWNSPLYKAVNVALTVEGKAIVEARKEIFGFKDCYYLITIAGDNGEAPFEYPICGGMKDMIKIYQFEQGNKTSALIGDIQNGDRVQLNWVFDATKNYTQNPPLALELTKL